jgi:hypothetical protein
MMERTGYQAGYVDFLADTTASMNSELASVYRNASFVALRIFSKTKPNRVSKSTMGIPNAFAKVAQSQKNTSTKPSQAFSKLKHSFL